VWAALRAKIDEKTGDTAILTKLRTYFEERFRYDEHGVPRVWKPDDDIDSAFTKAKDVMLELISLYAKIVPQDSELAYTPPEDGEDDTPGLVVLSETKALELGAWFAEHVRILQINRVSCLSRTWPGYE
jgi:protein SEY1